MVEPGEAFGVKFKVFVVPVVTPKVGLKVVEVPVVPIGLKVVTPGFVVVAKVGRKLVVVD